MQVLRLVGSELEVPVSRAELKSISVVGADMVLTKQDGSIILLKGLALEAVVGDGATRVVFKDGAVPAQSLLGEVPIVDGSGITHDCPKSCWGLMEDQQAVLVEADEAVHPTFTRQLPQGHGQGVHRTDQARGQG